MNDPIEPNAPQPQELRCNQGAAFPLPLGFYNPINGSDPPQPDLTSPLDLTGYSWNAGVFDSQTKRRAPMIVAFTVTTDDLAHGLISLHLTAAQTLALTQGDYYYDLKGTPPGGEPTYFMAGTFMVLGRKS